MLVKDDRLLQWVRANRQPNVVQIERPESDFPELLVTVPDAWPSIKLAPWYDVHLGAREHDHALFQRHKQWMIDTPNVLSWGGGDLIENASKLSVGAGVYEQDFNPQHQGVQAVKEFTDVAHKMLFELPGNHEDRINLMGIDIAQWIAWMHDVSYFSDYCMCVIRWRGNNFRILAHHGSGGAQTAGAQRMAARKALAWAKPFDMFWTGHLHNALADVLFQTDFDQQTQRVHERNGIIMISPSYLRYFGSYAAKSQYTPGTRGLAVAELQADGRIDVSIHANGKRL